MGVILLCLCAAGYMIWQVMDIYPEGYTAEQLGIEELYSTRDENGNGTDDYHDFVAGARAYVESGPLYQSIYYAGGYPDDEHGVCTDVRHPIGAIANGQGVWVQPAVALDEPNAVRGPAAQPPLPDD